MRTEGKDVSAKLRVRREAAELVTPPGKLAQTARQADTIKWPSGLFLGTRWGCTDNG